MMDRGTDGLEGVFAYMDNSRVGSPDRQTHLLHLDAFFTALAANGLAINLEKCVFATPSLEILGHKILVMGVAPPADHAAEIANCPPPSGLQATATFSLHDKLLLPFLAHLCTGFETSNRSPERGGPKLWSGPLPHRRHFKMQNVSWRRQYPSNTLPPMLNFLWSLTPPILISD